VARKKFHTEKWAEAFLNITGENAENVYYCLKALSEPIKAVPGAFFGYSASLQLEEILRDSLASCRANDQEAQIDEKTVEYAIRFICILVEKKCFRYINSFLRRIEQKLNEQKGILSVSIETASSLDSEHKSELKQMIRERTGATDVKMGIHVKPELLGGYLLRIGAFYIDASLKGQLEKMKEDLRLAAAQPLAAAEGGNV
jgi:ATP synthase F1 delta subunit